MNILSWFTDPANWTGSGGIPAQIGYHLFYSAIALLAALAIAVPLGILIGYTGRGEALVAQLPSGQTLITTASEVPTAVHPERRLRVCDGRIEEGG